MNENINYLPEGRSTICPFLVVDDVRLQISFLRRVFDVQMIEQLIDSEGNVRHCELKIGDVAVMIGPANADYPSRNSLNFVYVPNVDEIFRDALQNGAKPFIEPSDKFYGIRDGAFFDPNGNEWWVGTQVEKLTNEEIQQRMKKL